MKLNKTTLIAALALGSLLTLGATVNAQDATTTNAPATTAPAGASRRPMNIDQMVKLLALTDDQKTNFQATMQDLRKQMMDLRADNTLSTEDRHAKNKSIRDAAMAKMKDILTPDQFAKYQKMMMGGRRQAPPAAVPAATPPATN